MQNIAMMGGAPLPASWTPLPPQTVTQSTDPHGDTTKASTLDGGREFGSKQIIDWYRDMNLSPADPKAFDTLINQLKTYKSPMNPHGDINNPFGGGSYPMFGNYPGMGPNGDIGKGITIHNIETGMSEPEKMAYRAARYGVDSSATPQNVDWKPVAKDYYGIT
jgi:hypothetical protein